MSESMSVMNALKAAGFVVVQLRELEELKRWRQVPVDILDLDTPTELEEWIQLSGLSIHVGQYGEWGCDTLECLFAELGIQPGDTFEEAVEHVLMAAGGEIQTCTNWRGDGLALFEMLDGGTRHRWRCFDCDERGPAEVDGAVCRWQLKRHKCGGAP